MGLDMYALKTTESVDKAVDFKVEEYTEIFYWRKHPNLHGWMSERYFERGGANPDFNCDTLRLTKNDLDRLETAIIKNELPVTSGFFFGQSSCEERARDLEFVAIARKALNEGYTVFYDSWW